MRRRSQTHDRRNASSDKKSFGGKFKNPKQSARRLARRNKKGEDDTARFVTKRTGWKSRPVAPDRNDRLQPDRVHRAEPALIRLNKYIAGSGICSRREADELITAGLITVNGKTVTGLGTRISPDDTVRYNGEKLFNEKKRYILLNKPKDFITTTDDPRKRNTVMQLIKNACRERVYPVGRLDRNTTGLLLFTNDGELAKRLMHPSYRIKKLYHVETDRPLSHQDLNKLRTGIELEDGLARADEAEYAHPSLKNQIGIEIHEGRNRIVRRMFEALGYEIKKLDRVMYAGLTKKDLPRGRWRHLSQFEINMLKMLTGKQKQN